MVLYLAQFPSKVKSSEQYQNRKNFKIAKVVEKVADHIYGYNI